MSTTTTTTTGYLQPRGGPAHRPQAQCRVGPFLGVERLRLYGGSAGGDHLCSSLRQLRLCQRVQAGDDQELSWTELNWAAAKHTHTRARARGSRMYATGRYPFGIILRQTQPNTRARTRMMIYGVYHTYAFEIHWNSSRPKYQTAVPGVRTAAVGWFRFFQSNQSLVLWSFKVCWPDCRS